MTLLHDTAHQSFKKSYAPYTRCPAGVAIETATGAVYRGSTFENAAYMHGIEPLEAAVGQMLTEEPWPAESALPVMTRVCVCHGASAANHKSYSIPRASAALLRLFAQAGTTVIHALPNGDTAAEYTCAALFETLPGPSYDWQTFLDFAQNRLETAVMPDAFSEPALKTLFDTRLKAFDPLSRYAVSARVETNEGQSFYGVNCEPGGNKALHAEAMAIARMITSCGPGQTISHVTILTAGRPGFPCGGCRQYIREFSNAETMITAMNTAGESETVPFDTLLPRSFGPDDLRAGAHR